MIHGSVFPRIRLYRGWWIVASGFVSQMATTGTTGWIFGVLLLPMQQTFGWSGSALVGVLTVSSLTGGSLSAALGPWAGPRGVRGLMTLSACWPGSCWSRCALSHRRGSIILLLGLGFGLAVPGLQNLGPAVAISNWFIRRRPLAITLFSFGSLAAGIVLTPAMPGSSISPAGRRPGRSWARSNGASSRLPGSQRGARPEDVGLLPDGVRPGRDVQQPGSFKAGRRVHVGDEPAAGPSVRRCIRGLLAGDLHAFTW